MTQQRTLSQEIERLISGNNIYTQYKPEWTYLLNSYLGGKDYRDAGYLTRYQLETDSEYFARLRNTPIENHCASVISVYNSFLFRECPERDFGDLANMPEIEDFLKDADLDGRSLNSFMKDVATWASVFGHCWILVSKPDVGAVTRADEIAMGVRPYVSLVTPMAVLDWSWTRLPSGRYELDYLKYVEDINGEIQTIKEWTNEVIKTTTVDVGQSLINEEIIEINGLGRIPAVICYNARSIMRGIGISDINDIADAQRYIYNATSEIDQSIRLDSHPSLVTTNEVAIGTGAGAIIKMPENLDPGLKPYVLDFAGANIANILSTIQHTIDSIDKMANTGSVRATESRTMSGVAMETEFQLLNARLSEKADNIELAEEGMWKLFAEYMGYEWKGCVEYPGSFNIRDTNQEIEQLRIAASTSPADPRVKAAIDSKILDWLDLDEDELTAMMNNQLIDLDSVPEQEDRTEFYLGKSFIDPVSGVVTIASTPEEQLEMVKMGWIEYEGDE